MRVLGVVAVLLVCTPGGVRAKIFEKCELARLLHTKHAMPRDDVKNWVCIAEFESTFNTEAINKFNWDGSYDYGLFQLNNKYWCDGHSGKNVCKMACSALLDDDLTDDLRCISRIIKDTERWKGKGTGLTAWVAYVKRCQNRNLDAYISECWDGIQPTTTTDSQPIDNFIPRVTKEHKTSTTTTTTTTTTVIPPTKVSSPDISKNELQDTVASLPNEAANETPDTVASGIIIPSARVPYPSHHQLRTPAWLSRQASTAIHLRSTSLPMMASIALAQVRPENAAIAMSSSRGNVVAGTGSSISLFVTRPVLSYSGVDSMPLTQVRVGASPLGPSLTVYEKIDGHH